MRISFAYSLLPSALLLAGLVLAPPPASQQPPSPPFRFDLTELPFHLNSNESPPRNAPESMAGGIAVFHYNAERSRSIGPSGILRTVENAGADRVMRFTEAVPAPE